MRYDHRPTYAQKKAQKNSLGLPKAALLIIQQWFRLQTAFEAAGSFETNGLGGCDFHRLTSLRIASHTGSALLNGECSKTDKLHFFGFLDSSRDSIENGVYGIFSGTFGRFFAHGFLYGFNKFGFIHGGKCFAEKPPMFAR